MRLFVTGVAMNFILHGTLLCVVFICSGSNAGDYYDDFLKQLFSGTRKSRDYRNHRHNVVAGIDDSTPVNETNCLIDEIRQNPSLSNSAECARTCRHGEPPKTCYYKFNVEVYPINGIACQLCTPNVTNRICPNCQCVPGDGVERMALVVNRMLPGPTVEVCLGDLVVVDVENKVKGLGITIHWHGIFQHNSQYYDGVPFVTQCPISEGTTFRYQYRVKNEGTHFWHAHTALHKMDGIVGSLVVRQPVSNDPNGKLYDYDLSKHVVLINDWMHEEATSRFPGRNSNATGGTVGQLPDSVLINGKGRYTLSNGKRTNSSIEVFTVKRNKRYRFRLINAFCTTCYAELTIQGHNLTGIATDGQNFKPVMVNSIISFPGERYDFVVNTNQPPGAYWIQVRARGGCEDSRIQQFAILQYEGASTKPLLSEPEYTKGLPRGVVLNPTDGVCHKPRTDAICISNLASAEPPDPELLKEEPDLKWFLPVTALGFTPSELFRPNRYQKFIVPAPNAVATTLIDGIGFSFPTVPPLSQPDDLPPDPFCNAENLPSGCKGNCTCTHVIDIPLGHTVEFLLIDEFQVPDLLHPFHLHGHSFRVLCMGQPFSFVSSKNNTNYQNQGKGVGGAIKYFNQRMSRKYAMELDKKRLISRRFDEPPAKDTLPIPNNGYAIIRFRANNPGYWLFHCHFVYHQIDGMELILRVGKQRDLPPVPRNFPKCGDFKPPIKTHASYDSYFD